jgi:RNA polymerase sigma-70 factor (ECF subfamily)
VLYGLCLKYSRNKNEAEDNLHDSFVTIFQKMHQYGFKGSFEGWMKRITINTVLQKYRKEEPLALMTELPDPVEEVYSEEETEVSLSTLLKYIQELPTKYRITFNLYVLDGYSHKEISEALGTSQGTSKSNLARARMILQEKILKKKQIA